MKKKRWKYACFCFNAQNIILVYPRISKLRNVLVIAKLFSKQRKLHKFFVKKINYLKDLINSYFQKNDWKRLKVIFLSIFINIKLIFMLSVRLFTRYDDDDDDSNRIDDDSLTLFFFFLFVLCALMKLEPNNQLTFKSHILYHQFNIEIR